MQEQPESYQNSYGVDEESALLIGRRDKNNCEAIDRVVDDDDRRQGKRNALFAVFATLALMAFASFPSSSTTTSLPTAATIATADAVAPAPFNWTEYGANIAKFWTDKGE